MSGPWFTPSIGKTLLAPARACREALPDNAEKNAVLRSASVSDKAPSGTLARNAVGSFIRAAAAAGETLLPIIRTWGASESAVAARSRCRPLATSGCLEVGRIFSTSDTDENGLVVHHENSIAAVHSG